MGSSSLDNCTENGVISEQLFDEHRHKRPDFYPCEVCGRKFTMRAMEVHKRSCLETEGCQCVVCKSGAKKLKSENDEIQEESLAEDISDDRLHLKTKNTAHVKPRIKDLLTGKTCSVKNEAISDDNNLISFKLVENHIIDKMVGGSNPLKSEESSLEFNPNAMLNDHKYVIGEMFENSDKPLNSSDQLAMLMKFNDKTEHDCTRKIFCTVCSEHIYWELFGLHLIKHCQVLNNDLKCPACDRIFNKPACILTHYIVHIYSHPEYCIDCRCGDSRCIDARNRAIAEHTYADSSLYYCYICLTRFSHNQTVVNHMRLHTNEMPYTCTECNRSFRQIGNLQRHMTTHRGDRPHKCPDCCRSFADPATLRNHLRVHTGETPYVCRICKRGFTQVGNLKRHMALHLPKDSAPPSGDKSSSSSSQPITSDESTLFNNLSEDSNMNPSSSLESSENNNIDPPNPDIISEIVEATFPDEVNSKSRKRRKNQKMKLFTCEICKKVYAWHHDLVVHFRTHTGEKPFQCDMCDKRFAQSGAVRIHKERHHAWLLADQERQEGS